MKTVCRHNLCSSCYACIAVCKFSAVTIKDTLESYNAIIDEKKCVNCGLCIKVCHNNSSVDFMEHKYIYQGWANNYEIRSSGSSGGIATALASTFIINGGVVCSCAFLDGEFQFVFFDSLNKLKNIQGSKYIYVSVNGIHEKIGTYIASGKNVLFIGLPCQVAGVKKYCSIAGIDDTKLYAIDLICHGTPSQLLLESFINENGLKIKNTNNIQFRKKKNFNIYVDNKKLAPKGIQDNYTTSYLLKSIYTENCYSCKYAQEKRISDITLGDSWGSQIDNKQVDKGISLLLVQTEKGYKIVKESNIYLTGVNFEKAIEFNRQLKQPSEKGIKREKFFFLYKSGIGFNHSFKRCYPIICYKKRLKRLLIKLGIKKISY